MEGWVVPKGKRKIKMNKHCDYRTNFFIDPMRWKASICVRSKWLILVESGQLVMIPGLNKWERLVADFEKWTWTKNPKSPKALSIPRQDPLARFPTAFG